MKKCPSCGYKNNPTAISCNNCYMSLDDSNSNTSNTSSTTSSSATTNSTSAASSTTSYASVNIPLWSDGTSKFIAFIIIVAMLFGANYLYEIYSGATVLEFIDSIFDGIGEYYGQ